MTGAREPGTDEYILRHKILFIGNSIGLQVSLSWKLPIVKCLRGPFTPHGGQDLTRGAAIWIPLRLILTTDDSLQRIRDIYFFNFFLNVIDYMTFTDEYQSHPQLLDQSRPIHTASISQWPSSMRSALFIFSASYLNIPLSQFLYLTTCTDRAETLPSEIASGDMYCIIVYIIVYISEQTVFRLNVFCFHVCILDIEHCAYLTSASHSICAVRISQCSNQNVNSRLHFSMSILL